MKLIIAFTIFIHLSSLSPLKQQLTPRRYFPEENDPYRIKEIFYEKNGKLHVEDLTVRHKEKNFVSPQDITMYLYTRQYPKMGFPFVISDFNTLKESKMHDYTKSNYFIIHGWLNDYNSEINVLITEAVLEEYDVNVFVVDWSTIASKFYLTSKAAVPKIGQFLGDFINRLMTEYNLSEDTFKLVGHSLGAHIAGCTGAAVNGTIDYIVGLDPAGPLFTLSNTDERLDITDANFVQIIHTSGKILGFRSAIGHADYFPNDGITQPGCSIDLFGICAHSRAYYYFAESIRQGRFTAKQCSSYKDFKDLKCNHGENSFIGRFHIDTRAAGDYYLDTNTEEPYALG